MFVLGLLISIGDFLFALSTALFPALFTALRAPISGSIYTSQSIFTYL